MSSNAEIQQKLLNGIAAAKRGDKITARRLLEQVVVADQYNESAWLWLASVVSSTAERRACLARVLEINPLNDRAREALQRLDDESPAPASTTSTPRATTFNIGRGGTTPSATGDTGALPVDRSYLILGGLVFAVVVVIVAIISVFNTGGQPVGAAATSTVEFAPAASETPTPTLTATPDFTATNTRTPIPREQLTFTGPTLPPTFTPTRTPSPTQEATDPVSFPADQIEIFYTSRTDGFGEPDLYTIRADGSNESLVIENVFDIAFNPAGDQIAFTRRVESALELFVVSTGNFEAPTQITTLGAADTGRPSWSPDGSRILFHSNPEGGDFELFIVNADGENLQQLTDNDVLDRDPTWSPDGTQIVYTSDLESAGFLTSLYSRTLPEEGDPVTTRLTDLDNNSFSPMYSQDGGTVLFVSDRFIDADVFTMNPDGTNENLVTSDDGTAEDRAPAISSNGRYIAFIANREDEVFQLYIYDAQTSQVTRLTNSGREDRMVIFRPRELQ